MKKLIQQVKGSFLSQRNGCLLWVYPLGCQGRTGGEPLPRPAGNLLSRSKPWVKGKSNLWAEIHTQIQMANILSTFPKSSFRKWTRGRRITERNIRKRGKTMWVFLSLYVPNFADLSLARQQYLSQGMKQVVQQRRPAPRDRVFPLAPYIAQQWTWGWSPGLELRGRPPLRHAAATSELSA